MRTVFLLGAAQTLSWAGTYYVPAILAAPMARDLGVPLSAVFLAFSLALLITAVLGPAVGRAIDRRGGRAVMALGNGVSAAGLVLLSLAEGPVLLFASWVLLGFGMAAALYEAAFATLARLLGKEARGAITGITLIAGFASTLGWPLSALLEAELGWRGACLAWAGVQLLLCVPLNLLLPRPPAAAPAPPAPPPTAQGRKADLRASLLLAFAFAAGGFSAYALSAHLPGLLVAAGASAAAAVAAAALLGPAQVGARLLEFSAMKRFHPLASARLANLSHPLGAAALLLFGGPAAAALFCVLHGMGNGVQTIARGTLPLAIFGPAGYGARQGLIVAPTRFLGALAPALFGLALEAWGAWAVLVTAGLSLASFLALMAVRPVRA